jgi:hypothetical protein
LARLAVFAAFLVGSSPSFQASAAFAPRITGTVRDPAGQPVSGLALSVVPEYMLNNHNITTDARGRFEIIPSSQNFGTVNNKLCVVARDPARNLAAAEDIEEDTTTLDLRLTPAQSVAGALTDLDGKPLTTGTAQLNIWVGSMGSSLGGEPSKTDARGHFVINALPANRRFWLWAAAPGYGSASRNIETGEPETNRIELEPFPLKVANLPLAGRVVDADEKPATNAWVSLSGEGQPSESVRTDRAGRFKFKGVCEGSIRLFANALGNGRPAFANATAEAGDTNVVIVVGSNASALRQRPKRPALKGRTLPDLASVGLDATAVPPGKPVLICLFDIEQRPSRRFARLLAEQAEALQRNGLIVVGVQAAPGAAAALTEWQAANPLPFPVGQIARETDVTKWVTEIESFPWMILAGADRKVAAEGFALEELEAKIEEMKK